MKSPPDDIRFYLQDYPYIFPAPPLVGDCRLEDHTRNYNPANTWNGWLVGPKDDVVATLAGWGIPRVTVTTTPLSIDEARELVEMDAPLDE